MSYLIVQILLCLLVAGLIGLIIGWLISKISYKKMLLKNDDVWYKKLTDDKNECEKKFQVVTREHEAQINNEKQKLFHLKEQLQHTEKQRDEFERLYQQQEDVFNNRLKKLHTDWEEEVEQLREKLNESELALEEKKKRVVTLQSKSINSTENENLQNEVAKLQKELSTLKHTATEQEFQLNVELTKIREINHEYEKKLEKSTKEIQLLKQELHENLQKHSNNLQEIDGIDDELEKRLNTLGVYQFEQIAKWDEKQIDWINNYFSFNKRVEQEKWIEQAIEKLKQK